ncbi:ribonuclease III [Mesorhizobium sp. M0761]|jgi:ribonuclease III|uniref:ribonuclease III n=1 Tax=unclassified Mesorhizobium TaxID=325217 RepID=UPI0003CEE694|nr:MULTISPECIES: ribonuclease III [unclassified Mesorhizobium]ESX03858.1 ribonuclease III [Mesorhizobium sp. LSJC268A00]ESX15170.1 ribonuclease III [Mesorhizobium sp. LSJC264A00]ESX17681.1 ribonuclease III [Mesorhizobium sp. LSJC255A00]ESX27084.1 ribonuclease III [Mesorhizobium sp. LSHC440B00]ESX36270.1 ribonuclease III [Mesorhizobium sp. LSHC432A00]
MALKRPTGETLADLVTAKTGHSFRDVRLLETALTHSSAVKASSNNQRLEFLGDRVLGLIVADLLFEKFPEAPEGEIAPRFNALVDARTCSEIGIEMQLEDLVRADAALKARSRGSGGNYLADAVEALIAAVYIDGGLDAARQFVLRYWEPRSQKVVAKPPNPKSDLQEWIAKTSDVRPEYAIEKREGPEHQPVFTVSVKVGGFAPASGTGGSRRAAEEAAASAFLMREGIWANQGSAA